jgi:hypothetical protein
MKELDAERTQLASLEGAHAQYTELASGQEARQKEIQQLAQRENIPAGGSKKKKKKGGQTAKALTKEEKERLKLLREQDATQASLEERERQYQKIKEKGIDYDQAYSEQ